MGVPHLYRYLTTRYKSIVIPADSLAGAAGSSVECDVLMLDLNCAVHRCAEVAARTHAHARDALQDAVIQQVICWIESILQHVCCPVLELCIALDGVPPRAKTIQQRSRRFMSALRAASAPTGEAWDACCVTPGTEFMGLLCARLHQCVPRLASMCHRGCSVHVTDSTEPGEGEHKLFARLETLPETHRKRVVVYGADADLIMLCLRWCALKPYILREVPTPGPDAGFCTTYEFLDIDELRGRLQQAHAVTPDEFVAVTLLLGNDFVPALSCLRVREQGIDVLMDMFARTRAAFAGRRFVSRDSTGTLRFDYAMLVALIDRVAEIENRGFAKLDAMYSEAVRGGAPLCNDPWIRPFVFDGAASGLQCGRDGWRARYYASLLPAAHMIRVCDGYVSGLAWTLAYYSNYTRSRARLSDWHYAHAYSPTAHDLALHVRRMGQDAFDTLAHAATEVAGAVTQAAIKNPALQLLLVLPPRASYLLPEHLRCIMTDVQEGCLHFYPTTFRVHSYLKWHASDCAAILPDIDGDHVARAVARVQRRCRAKQQRQKVSQEKNQEKTTTHPESKPGLR